MKPYTFNTKLTAAETDSPCPKCGQPTRSFQYRCPHCGDQHRAFICSTLGDSDTRQRCRALDPGTDHGRPFLEELLRELATLSAELTADMARGLSGAA